MKKIKLLTSLTALPLLGVSLMPLSSCSCSSTQYTITFDTQGGSSIASVKVDKGLRVVKPTDPTKQGYVFKGWFIEKECTNEFDFNTKITSNITLYAKWVAEEVLVTSVAITNTTKFVKEGEELELTAEVKPDNATNKELEWTVTAGAGTASITTKDNKTYLKGTTAGPVSVKAKAKDAGGVESAAVEFEVKSSYVEEFSKTDLSVIISAINTFEASSQDETAMRALCATFSDITYIGDISSEITDPNRQIEAHLGNFIGKTISIKINNQNHEVRVIGINHDLLEGQTTKYAAFTFEMVTLLSDDNGDVIKSKWDLTNSFDYTNSVLRWNLNGAGSGAKPVSDVWEKSALSMLPSEISSAIKTVNKKVATKTVNKKVVTSTNSESSYNVVDYIDKLFPLTYTEMAQTGDYAKVEGSAYKYWSDHNTNAARIKKDAKGTANSYWLCSPRLDSDDSVWFVNSDGYVHNYYFVYNPNGVSFGFCI